MNALFFQSKIKKQILRNSAHTYKSTIIIYIYISKGKELNIFNLIVVVFTILISILFDSFQIADMK